MVNLSNRGYPMLRMFAEERPDYFMSREEAQRWDQRPFRSMLIRKWISWRPGRGFYLTREGRAAWDQFLTTDILRKDPNQPLTAYFDAAAYGLKKPASSKAPLQVVKRGAA